MDSLKTPALINQTFIEGLHLNQELAVKEFTELKKIDVEKRREERIKEKLQKGKIKDEHLVFNYLWRYFPETMATKEQNPQLLRQEMGESEFKRILKLAKRFYSFRTFLWFVPTITITTSTILVSLSLGIDYIPLPLFFDTLSLICVFLGCSFLYSPEFLGQFTKIRRKHLIELYQNQVPKKQNELKNASS